MGDGGSAGEVEVRRSGSVEPTCDGIEVTEADAEVVTVLFLWKSTAVDPLATLCDEHGEVSTRRSQLLR